MKRTLCLLFLAIGCLAAIWGCSQGSKEPGCIDAGTTTNNNAQSALTKVKINQAFENLLYIGLYVAKDGGFFEKEGLDVKIETGGGDAQTFSALTSGKVDFAQGDPAFVAIAHEKGWEGKVVAAAVHRAALWGVTFDKNIKPFKDPAGFKNLAVATFPKPNTSFVMQEELAKRGHLTVGKDTKIVQVPFGTELATLKNNRADIAQTLEPNVSQVEAQGGTVAFSYADAMGPILFTGVMTSQKMINEKPEVVSKFVKAYDRALKYIHTDQAGTVAIAKKRFPDIDEKIIASSIKRCVDSGSVPESALMPVDSWKAVLNIRLIVGDLKALPTVDLTDNTFAEAAQK